MPSAFVLLRCIGKAAVKYVAKSAVKNVVNLFTFGVGGDIVVDAWDYWQKATREEYRPGEVQAVAQMSAAELRSEVARIVHEEASALDEPQQSQITSYLSHVPDMVRRSLRRPSDPTGTTIAVGASFRKPEDLLPLLPDSLPRFKAGDRPVGIGDWELVELLGVGGFGEVWKACNPHFDGVAPVALKFCLDAAARNRLLEHEAVVINQVMRQGKHEGIVPLLHTYLNADPPCLAYEYIAGGDLAAFIQERRNGLPAEQAARVIQRLATIVGFAHRLNPPIVHRDLKPANILVKSLPDRKLALRITDFGIGGLAIQEAMSQSRRGTKSEEFLAAAVRGAYTPLYASPQQMHGDKPDPRDDVYALGVIWYQLLTGDLTKGRPGGDAWRKRLTDRGMTPALLALLASSFEDERVDRPANAMILTEKLLRILNSGCVNLPKKIAPSPEGLKKPDQDISVPKPEPKVTEIRVPLVPMKRFSYQAVPKPRQNEVMRCPSCSAVLRVPGNCSDQSLLCPQCRTTLTATAKELKVGITEESLRPSGRVTSLQKIELTGRWEGDKHDVWELQGILELGGNHVRGRMRRQLVDCPPKLPWANRVGHFRVEFVEGTLELDCLTLRGHKVDDKTFLVPNSYSIVVSRDWKSFEGTTHENNYGGGIVRGSVSIWE